ncbi:MAG: DUF2004 domain-containing protein [Cytophagaceae bacterium]|nr:DUF2004 domain-containing protein [Cytophagaceae bacterium]
MTALTLPYFGSLKATALEEYYEVDIKFDGNEVQIDLTFENKEIDPSKLVALKKFLENIDQSDALNKGYINKDYKDKDGDTVKFYLEHHLEEIDEESLSSLIDFNDKTIDPEKQLLNKLHLVRIGFHPDHNEGFAIFDYSIDPDFTDYLVVITTDKDGKLNHMTMES